MQKAQRVAARNIQETHSRKAGGPTHGKQSNSDPKKTFRQATTDKLCWWQEI